MGWRMRALQRRMRQWAARNLARRRFRTRSHVRSLFFLYIGIAVSAAVITVAVQQPAWVRFVVHQIGAGVKQGAQWIVPAMYRTLQPSGESAAAIVEDTLPYRYALDHEPSPATTWLMTLRAWIFVATAYDVWQPDTFLEAELPGYAHLARSGRETVRSPGSDPASNGDTPPMNVPDERRVDDGGTPAQPADDIVPGEPIAGGGTEPDGTSIGRSDDGARDPLQVLREVDWGDEPLVAVLHTHPSEMYRTDTFAPANPNDYHRFDTTDTGVVRVGARIVDILWNEYGIPAVHDTTLHNTPCHHCAYAESRVTAQRLIRSYPSLEFIFDIHRDGAVDVSMLTSVGDETVAQLAIAVGRGHNQWTRNLAAAETIAQLFNEAYPGVFRRILHLDHRYNQDLHPRFLLVEMGNYYDHEKYALRTAEMLAEIIAKALYLERFGEAAWN